MALVALAPLEIFVVPDVAEFDASALPPFAWQAQLEAVKAQYDETVKAIQEKFEDRKDKLERGDELERFVRFLE